MRSELTLKELAEKYGENKRIRILCEDDESIVLIYRKKQKSLNEQEYSFDTGI